MSTQSHDGHVGSPSPVCRIVVGDARMTRPIHIELLPLLPLFPWGVQRSKRLYGTLSGTRQDTSACFPSAEHHKDRDESEVIRKEYPERRIVVKYSVTAILLVSLTGYYIGCPDPVLRLPLVA